MDVEDLDKVANRKRLLDEIQKAGGKVAQDKSELIKLQIANETAFWELKEKLTQKEIEHDTLQQNMVSLQMEYETLSAKYQEELQHRSEVLNKLAANQKMSDVLQENMQRVMEAVSQLKSDKAVLCDTFKKADNVVRDLKETRIKEMEKADHKIELLERTITMKKQHQAQLSEVYSACKQKMDEDLNELKNKLEEVAIKKDELSSTASDLNRQLDMSKAEIEKKDERILTLQRELKEMTNIQNAQLAETRETKINKETQLKKYDDEIERLKEALANKEAIAKEVRDKSDSLKEREAELREKYQRELAAYDELKTVTDIPGKLKCVASLKELNSALVKKLNDKCHEMNALAEKQNNEIALLKGKHEALTKELTNICQVISSKETELEKLKEYDTAQTKQIKELSEGLNNVLEESKKESEQVNLLAKEAETKEQIIADKEIAFQNYRAASEDKSKKNEAAIEEIRKKIEASDGILSMTMMNLQKSTEQKKSLEEELENAKREMELEMASSAERQTALNTQLAHLEAVIKSKDEELAQRMNSFLKMRNKSELERTYLREKHDHLMMKLDNIWKETTGTARGRPDNTVSMDPEQGPSRQPRSLEQPRDVVLQDYFEDMLSSTDHLTDGTSLDPQELYRRFDALFHGQPLPAAPPAMLKRRREDTLVCEHFASIATPQPHTQPRRSQPQPQPQPQRSQLQPQNQIDRSENVSTAPQQNVRRERRFFKSVKKTDNIKK